MALFGVASREKEGVAVKRFVDTLIQVVKDYFVGRSVRGGLDWETCKSRIWHYSGGGSLPSCGPTTYAIKRRVRPQRCVTGEYAFPSRIFGSEYQPP